MMRWVIFVFIVLAVLFPRTVKASVVFVTLALLLACVSIADHLVATI
jgi:hypothetical protein